MNCGFQSIVGKTIAGVVIKEGQSPRTQVFLVFSDNTHYELYSGIGRIEGSSSITQGGAEAVRLSDLGSQEIILEVVAPRRVLSCSKRKQLYHSTLCGTSSQQQEAHKA